MKLTHINARHTVCMPRQRHDGERGSRSCQQRIAAGLRVRTGMRRTASEFKVNLGSGEKPARSSNNGAEFELGRDVPADNHVNVVKHAGLKNRIGTARTFFCRLTDKADAAAEPFGIGMNEFSESDGSRLVSVMAAGMHHTAANGRKAVPVRQMRERFGLLNRYTVELDANGQRTARTTSVPFSNETGIIAHAAHQSGRNTVLHGKKPAFFNFSGIAPAHELRGNEVRTIGNLEAFSVKSLRQTRR